LPPPIPRLSAWQTSAWALSRRPLPAPARQPGYSKLSPLPLQRNCHVCPLAPGLERPPISCTESSLPDFLVRWPLSDQAGSRDAANAFYLLSRLALVVASQLQHSCWAPYTPATGGAGNSVTRRRQGLIPLRSSPCSQPASSGPAGLPLLSPPLVSPSRGSPTPFRSRPARCDIPAASPGDPPVP